MTRPIVLIILDGWGLAPPGPGNAVSQAKTPNMDSFGAVYPHTELMASGEAVGLPPGEMGNSETGHLNLGAGRVVYQDLPRINMAIADGTFFRNQAFLEAAGHVKQSSSRLHLMGLIGQGGVHSSMIHLFALLRFCQEQNLKGRVFLHLFTDGRDSPPTSAANFLNQVEEKIKEFKVGEIASVMGRYFAMDRDNRWERTQAAYETLVRGLGSKAKTAVKAVQSSYQEQKTDEFIEPTVIVHDNSESVATIADNDAVIFFNFRIDRPRQLTKAFVIPDFANLVGTKVAFDPYTERYYKKTVVDQVITQTFPRGPSLKNLFFVTMTEYERDLPARVAFAPVNVNLPLGRILSENGLRQLRITESEKERFITYYFNGQREDAFPAEERIIIPSPKVPTYDLKPEMSAREITQVLLSRIREGVYDFILVNYANPDMVGHTGVIKAGIAACEVVDQCVGEVVRTINNLGGLVIITADHGNIEEMINIKTGKVDTEHSTNPVPFITVAKDLTSSRKIFTRGVLADVAPTILSYFEIQRPTEMLGGRTLR